MANIQWFPGHMTKARRQMEENLKKVDFIIEVRDARIPQSSTNPMLDELARDKPRLILLSKTDKADPSVTQSWMDLLQDETHEVMALNLLQDRFQKDLVSRSLKLNQALIDKQKRRGIKPRALRAMVVGIPNVGKSTLINSLARKKAAKTADKPGVTRALQWIKVSKELELLDTPGVLWPKFEDESTGILLAALGSINDDILHLDQIVLYCVKYLMEHYPGQLAEAYGIELQEDAYETMKQIAKKRGWMKQDEIDQDRLMKGLITDIRSNRFGAISWESPDEPSV